jgi:hypothetical protein
VSSFGQPEAQIWLVSAPLCVTDVERLAQVAQLDREGKLNAINGKIPREVLDSYDVDFAGRMVLDFHCVDEKGIRFRYYGEKFGVNKSDARVPIINHSTSDTRRCCLR